MTRYEVATAFLHACEGLGSGPLARLRRETTLFDEIAIWKQILLQTEPLDE